MSKKEKVKETMPVVQPSTVDNQQLSEMYAEDYKENLEYVRDAFFKVSIQGGNYKVDGKLIGDGGKTFRGIILRTIPVNSWYKTPYDPANPTPPDCWSLGGIEPEATCNDVQSKECSSCPRNKWGTSVGRDGKPSKGKACSNVRRLIIKVPGIEFPVILHLPPTAQKKFNQYLKSLCINKPPLPVFAVISEFSFDTSKSYPLPSVSAGEKLSLEEYKSVREYKDSDIVKSAIRAYVETGSEYDQIVEEEEQKQEDCDL